MLFVVDGPILFVVLVFVGIPDHTIFMQRNAEHEKHHHIHFFFIWVAHLENGKFVFFDIPLYLKRHLNEWQVD